MGRPKIKIIDDSKPVEGPHPKAGQNMADKTEASKKAGKTTDDLVAKINAELGVTDQLSVISGQLSEKGQPVVSKSVEESVTDKPKADKLSSENRKQKTDNKPSKFSKSKPHSKKYLEAIKDLDKSKSYPLIEAIDLVKKISYSRFNGTLEAHINTATTGIRGLVSLPFASGKKLRILVFGKDATSSGADKIGDEATIEEIGKGRIDFDLLITTPDWMPKLAKVAKNLGPKGLMPNPKSGTIAEDLKKAVESFQSGKTEYEQSSKVLYETEAKAKVMHLSLGKLDQPTEQLTANIKTLFQTIGKTRVKKITLSPTMGPGVKVDLSSI